MIDLSGVILLIVLRKDWGALILVDERYSKGHHYTKGILYHTVALCMLILQVEFFDHPFKSAHYFTCVVV